jgi:glutamate N-acetyltransferase/amino-acid N-acetyltransferase
MIHPNMATMLCFLSTDIRIPYNILQKALHQAVETSFNSISVDGCMSPNDMVLCMANGKKSVGPLQGSGPLFRKFSALLQKVCTDLAQKIVRDGEGATKFVELRVQGAPSSQWAKKVGTAVALSPLVKTAFFGEDANWGRILSAVGNCGLKISEKQVDISFGGMPLVKNGTTNPRISEKKINQYLKGKNIVITLDLHTGKGKWVIWTCDFSYDYVRINASYRT